MAEDALTSSTTMIDARLEALEARASLALGQEELEAVWFLLQRAGQPGSADNSAVRLNFDDFTQAGLDFRELVGPAVADCYFRPSCFLRLARDASGCVPAPALLHYLAARSTQLRLRAQLGALDASGAGVLTPATLVAWLVAHAPAGALAAAGLAEGDWVAVVAARLQLLHGRRGRLPIKELVGSPAVVELAQSLDLLAAEEARVQVEAADEDRGPRVATLLLEQLARGSSSWAAPTAVAALRARFRELDADGDGLLSQADFAGFSGAMTPLFISRLFAQHCSAASSSSQPSSAASGPGGGEPQQLSGASLGGGAGGMDFAAFAAFCGAWEGRHTPAGLRYLFPVLDLHGRGWLDSADLHTWFREVQALWLALGQWEGLRAEDVVAELADLLRPVTPGRFTAADFRRCGLGGAVVGLLSHVGELWAWENREALMGQAAAQAEEQAAAAAAQGQGGA